MTKCLTKQTNALDEKIISATEAIDTYSDITQLAWLQSIIIYLGVNITLTKEKNNRHLQKWRMWIANNSSS